jgi:hypothetical protein
MPTLLHMVRWEFPRSTLILSSQNKDHLVFVHFLQRLSLLHQAFGTGTVPETRRSDFTAFVYDHDGRYRLPGNGQRHDLHFPV